MFLNRRPLHAGHKVWDNVHFWYDPADGMSIDTEVDPGDFSDSGATPLLAASRRHKMPRLCGAPAFAGARLHGSQTAMQQTCTLLSRCSAAAARQCIPYELRPCTVGIQARTMCQL